jgi:hypothetical protein
MKSRARAARWSKEITLVAEEMRRVLCFLKWKAKWWQSQGPRRDIEDLSLQEGLRAYSAKQSQIFEDMAHRFATLWYSELARINIEIEWPEDLLLRSVWFS